MIHVRRRLMHPGRLLVVAAALVLAGEAAAQQVRPQLRPPALPEAPDPNKTVPEKVDPPLQPRDDDTTGTLSDKLRDSRGVIRPPPSRDSEIVVPAPDTGTTPVIPPPGTPGGADAPTPR